MPRTGSRTGVLESEVIKPLVLCLLDPEEPPIPEAQLIKAVDVVESWMVRRMLVRATTKNYNQVIAELIALLRRGDRASAGDLIESYLAGQSSASRYWPDDAELQEELGSLMAYRRLGRGRLRNRQLLEKASEQWTDDAIRIRTRQLVGIIAQIWPVPPNHRSAVTTVRPRLRKKIDLSDLITGGALQPGMPLFPRRQKYSHRVATLLPDGRVEVDGLAFSSPSDAATAIAGKRTSGWWFFLTDQASQRSLRSVRRDYIDAMAVEAQDDEPDDDVDEDEG